MKYISTRSVPGGRNSAGLAYVIIPIDIDRQKYVLNCYRTNSVSIQFENGGTLDNVALGKGVLKDLSFPKTNKELGSALIWINLPKFNRPLIVAVIAKNNEIENLNEHQFLLDKRTENSLVEISGDAETGTLFINVDSFSSKGGELNIVLKNQNKTAQFKLFVLGDINLETQGNINFKNTKELNFTIQDLDIDNKPTIIKYKKGVGFAYTDEFGNQQVFNTDGMQLQDGSLGGLTNTPELKKQLDTQNQLLTALLTIIKGAPISEPGGGNPSAFQVALSGALTGQSLGDFSNIENTDITHGKKAS